ncbi:MAG: ASPIC/UnbV domain-containing protein, partial [Acidobacteriota bacterium]
FWTFTGLDDNLDGSLAVELNSGNNNRWLKVELTGGAGRIDGAVANRDGIGAVVEVTPRRLASTARPVLGGASYASQDALELTFGLGRKRRATVDITWPGGTRNRLYGARHGERLQLPEIPCSYDANWPRFSHYAACVHGALSEWRAAGEIDRRMKARLLSSALIAYFDAH